MPVLLVTLPGRQSCVSEGPCTGCRCRRCRTWLVRRSCIVGAWLASSATGSRCTSTRCLTSSLRLVFFGCPSSRIFRFSSIRRCLSSHESSFSLSRAFSLQVIIIDFHLPPCSTSASSIHCAAAYFLSRPFAAYISSIRFQYCCRSVGDIFFVFGFVSSIHAKSICFSSLSSGNLAMCPIHLSCLQ